MDPQFWASFIAQVGLATVIVLGLGVWFVKYGFPFIRERIERNDQQMEELQHDREIARAAFLDALDKRDRSTAEALTKLAEANNRTAATNTQLLVSALKARDEQLMKSMAERDKALLESIQKLVVSGPGRREK